MISSYIVDVFCCQAQTSAFDTSDVNFEAQSAQLTAQIFFLAVFSASVACAIFVNDLLFFTQVRPVCSTEDIGNVESKHIRQ